MANEFVVRNGLIVSGSTYLEAISQSNEAYILSYDSVTNEVAYMPTSSVVVTVPGADTQIIYNNGGVFGASSNLVFSGSRVGIGSANPARSIDVVSAAGTSVGLKLNSTATGGRSYSFFSTNNASGIGGGKFGIYDDTAQASRITLDGNGNVGIGSTSPEDRLDINGSIKISYPTGKLYAAAGGGFSGEITPFQANGHMVLNVNYPEGIIVFQSGSVEVARFRNTNLGIGTTNPAYKLDVNGTFRSNALWTDGSANAYWGNGSTPTAYGLLTWDTGIAKVFATSGNRLDLGANGSVAATINTAGNVGIGTTSPSYKLDVNGGSASSPFRVISTNTTSLRTFLEATSGNVEQHFLYTGNQDWVLGLDKADSNKFKLASADDGFASAKLTVTTGGSVGIGTTNPQYKLDLSGSFRVDGTNGDFIVDATGNDVYFTRNGTNYFYANQASSAISFQLGAGYSQSLFLKNDGNVGIGTASPAAKLDLAYSTNPTTATPHIILTTGGTSKQAAITAESFAVGGLVFSTGDGTLVDRMTITRTDGNVGIGITNPSHKLSVLGAVSASSFTGSFSGTSTNAISASFAATASSADAFYVRSTATVGSNFQIDSNGDFYQKTTGGAAIWSAVGNTTYPSYAFYNDLGLGMYRAAEDTLAFTTSGSERVRITSDGNLAINSTSTSGYRLYVNGSTWINGGTNFVDGVTILRTESGASEVMRIASGGNVGIGTTNPTAQLTLSKGAGNQMLQLINSSESGFKLHIHNSGSANTGEKVFTQYLGYNDNVNGYISFHRGSSGTDGYLSFGDNGGERVRFSNGGNVGIGTTSSGYKLEVNGTQRVVSNFYLYNTVTNVASNFTDQRGFGFDASTGATEIAASTVPLQLSRFSTTGDVLTIRHSGSAVSSLRTDGGASFTGNVGIGINSPSYKLHVSGGNTYMDGNLTVTGAITAQELYVQYISSSIIYSTGSNKFGDATNDIQYFTGSILQSGSLAYFAGSVGIGTASPSSRLSIQNSGTTDSIISEYRMTNGNNAATFRTDDNVIFGIHAQNAGDIYIKDASDNVLFYGKNGGNVGIGTTSPNYKLEVSGSTNVYHRLDVGTGIDWPSGTNNAVATFKQATSTGGLIVQEIGAGADRVIKLTSNGEEQSIEATYRDTGPYGNLAFKTSGSIRMYISSSGNIGIGTASPSYTLQVDGNTDSLIKVSNGATKTYLQSTYYGYSAGYDIMQIGDWYGKGSGGVGIALGIDPKIVVGGAFFGNEIALPEITEFITANGPSGSATDWNQSVLVITGSNISVGTNNPFEVGGTAKMSILGSSVMLTMGASTSNLMYFRQIGTGEYQIQTNNGGNGGNIQLEPYGGNVGIGTTSPGQKLQIDSPLQTEYYGTDSASPADTMNLVGTGAYRGLGTGSALLFSVPANTDGSNMWAQARILGTGDNGSNGNAEGAMFLQTRALYNPGVGGSWNWRTNMVLRASGNVGIGTTSPGVALQISRAAATAPVLALQTTDSTSNGYISWRNNSGVQNAAIGTNYGVSDTGAIEFISGSTTNMILRSSGRLGIGTTSPAYKLQVDFNSDDRLAINQIAANNFGVVFQYQGTRTWDIYNSGQANSNLLFYNQILGDNAVAFTSAGKVGVGTISPGALFQVKDGERAKAIFRIASTATASFYTGSFIQNSDDGGADGMLYGSTTGGSFPFDAYGETILQGNARTGYNSGISFVTGEGTSPAIRMRINASGNIGIGTTNPSSNLEVFSSANANTVTITSDGANEQFRIRRYTNTNEQLILGFHSSDFGYIQSVEQTVAYRPLSLNPYGGNVGIGVTNPAFPLQLNSTVGGGGMMSLLNTSGTESSISYRVSNGSATTGWVVGNSDNDYFLYSYTFAGQVATFKPSGNVGIGTTNPSNKLEVLGSATIRNSSGGGALNIGTNSGRTEYQYVTLGGGTGGTDYGWQVGRSPQTGGIINDGFYIYDIKTNNAPFAIALGGNVGIGTASPSTKLQVAPASAYTSLSGDGLSIWNPAVSSANIVLGFNGSATNSIQSRDGSSGTWGLSLNPFGGNVGIGTTSPTAKLQVKGDGGSTGITFQTTDSSNNQNFYVLDGGRAGTQYYPFMIAHSSSVAQTGQPYLQVATSVLYVSQSGAVGIGTASPEARLTVNGGTAGSSATMVAFNNGANAQRIDIIDEGSAYGQGTGLKTGTGFGLRLWASAGPVTLNTGGGSTIALMATGSRIGIGTIDPQATLQVTGLATNSGSTSAASPTGTLLLATDSGFNAQSYGSSLVFTQRWFNGASNQVAVGQITGVKTAVDGNFGGGLAFWTSNGQSDYLAERMRILSDGNVGIGTTNPTSLLHVGPASTPGSTATPTAIQLDNQYRNAVGGNTSLKFYLYKAGTETYGIGLNNAGGIEYHSGTAGDASSYQAFYFGNSERIRFKGDGNVGIGTTNPPDQLSVGKSTGTSVAITTNQSAGSSGSPLNLDLNFKGYADQKMAMIRSWDESSSTGHGSLTFWTNYFDGSNVFTEKMRITPLGNVGIGTTNPSQKLSVVGDFAIANTTSIQESRIGKYQSGSLGSGTHTIASVSVTGVDAVFFDYVIKNSTTDMRAGTVMAVTNGSTVEYTDISTADIGDTTRITMISDVSGGNIRLRASIDTASGSWTVRTLIRTI